MKSEEKRYKILGTMRNTIPGAQEMSLQDTVEFRKLWRNRFIGSAARDRTIPLHKCHACGSGKLYFDWHFFSYNVYIASTNYLEKIPAMSHPDERIIVFPDKCDMKGFVVRLGDLMEYLKANPFVGSDIYMTPKKMEWTLVFTHEEDFGPYFVKAV